MTVILENHHRLPVVLKLTGLTKSCVYRMMDQGIFPRPVKISERNVAWPESVLIKYMGNRKAA